MKQIRIFKNSNENLLVESINNFINDYEGKIVDMQYSCASGLLPMYSVMIVIED